MSEPLFDELLSRAFDHAPAIEANEAIARIRAEQGGEGAPALSYEVMIPVERPIAHLCESVLPRMIYFLDCRGAGLPHARGVFVSLFFGDTLHFLQVEDVIDVMTKASGLSVEQLIEQYGAASAG